MYSLWAHSGAAVPDPTREQCGRSVHTLKLWSISLDNTIHLHIQKLGLSPFQSPRVGEGQEEQSPGNLERNWGKGEEEGGWECLRQKQTSYFSLLPKIGSGHQPLDLQPRKTSSNSPVSNRNCGFAPTPEWGWDQGPWPGRPGLQPPDSWQITAPEVLLRNQQLACERIRHIHCCSPLNGISECSASRFISSLTTTFKTCRWGKKILTLVGDDDTAQDFFCLNLMLRQLEMCRGKAGKYLAWQNNASSFAEDG